MISAIDSEVWLPILTLVLGYVFSLITEAVRDRRQSDRERKAREDEREAVKEARIEEEDRRRREFQRSTLLELQEVLHDLGRTYGHESHLDVMNFRKTGSWRPRPLLDEEMNKMSEEANKRSNILLARVDNDRLRELVREMKDAGGGITIARSEEESTNSLDLAYAAFDAANQRIGELLRTT